MFFSIVMDQVIQKKIKINNENKNMMSRKIFTETTIWKQFVTHIITGNKKYP